MGFVLSFLIISALGFFSHFWYHKYGIKKGHLAWIFYYGFFVINGFLVLNVLIYTGFLDFIFPLFNNLPWVDIDCGRDFMWNSFHLLGFDWGINYKESNLDYIAILIFMSYPMWYLFFSNISRKFFGGNKPHEEGYWGVLKPIKKPKEKERIALIPRKT